MFITLITGNSSVADDHKIKYPKTKKIAVHENFHGTEVIDNYKWLEDSESKKVIKWIEKQNKLSLSILDKLPQRDFIARRFNELLRYDDESVPEKVLDGERIFFWRKKQDDEKWFFSTRANAEAEARVLINPNEWTPEETLDEAVPSRNGKYVAYGVAHGGDENPIFRVLEVETGKILPDTLRGWKQYVESWLPDNSGFYYSASPLKGEVPEGEENYWYSAYLHILGTPASEDKKVFYDNEHKEYWHSATVSEDGKYVVFYRGTYYQYEVYFKPVGSDEEPITINNDFNAQYNVEIINDMILIHTDFEAPRYKVYFTSVDKPGKEHWKEFIPEDPQSTLKNIKPIAGYIYATYEYNAHTQIRVYNLEGEYIRELPLPTLGSASLDGRWSQPEVWVSFSSYIYPKTAFRYDFDMDSLIIHRKFPVEVNVDNYTVEQVWYESKDGTPVSMFLVHDKNLVKNGENPVLLTGYGGFNISIKPSFSEKYLIWLESGGCIAIPNLRGGGEYGQLWHEAGMLDRKQNVFDDFIHAAEWLIDNRYTNPEKLAISGGSNGGLLVGAVTVQRPELFRVVNCAVPLLDMLTYHRFDYAKVWAEEYGSSDDPEQFKYLHAYSPYHNVVDGTAYPALVITAGERDARVDPYHARKMVARMQAANPKGKPILLLEWGSSGHGGGTTLSRKIEQMSGKWAFLMNELGMQTPETPGEK